MADPFTFYELWRFEGDTDIAGVLADRFADRDAAEARAVTYRALAEANGFQRRYEVRQCQLPSLA